MICQLKCILGGVSRFAVDLLHFACNSTFGLYGSMFHLMFAWIVLLDPPLCMGIAMLRGTQKYVGMIISVQCISWRSA